jgi:biotin transport system substrate-specific component
VHAFSPTLLQYSTARTPRAALLRAAVVAGAVAVTAAAAQFTTPLPFTAVPFTFTPLAVLLAGAALGSRLGAMSQVLYVGLGALGLAVFSPSATLPPGVLRLVGPTGGYLLAYPAAAFVTGWLSERAWDRSYLSSVAAMLLGLAVIYLGGVAWLTAGVLHSLDAAVVSGLLPFVALDVIKVAAGAMVLPRVWKALGPVA